LPRRTNDARGGGDPDGGAGRPIAFAQTPIEQVRQYSKDMAVMLEWFDRVGYSADVTGLEREFGRTLTKLPDCARRTRDQMGAETENSIRLPWVKATGMY